jgi:hypothetical protein
MGGKTARADTPVATGMVRGRGLEAGLCGVQCRPVATPPLAGEYEELGVQLAVGDAADAGGSEASEQQEPPGVASRAPTFIRAAMALYRARPETDIDLRAVAEAAVARIRAIYGADIVTRHVEPQLAAAAAGMTALPAETTSRRR